MLNRVKYLDPPGPNVAQWLRVQYIDGTLTREQIGTTSGESDVYHDWTRRISRDNGRTWSEFEKQPQYHRILPAGSIAIYPQGRAYDPKLRISYQCIMTYTWRGLPLYTYDWQTGNHPCRSHVFMNENGVARLLRFEEGSDYNADDPFDVEYCATNQAYVGQSVIVAPDGTAFVPLMCADRGKRLFSSGGLRLMRRDPASGQWLSSCAVWISPEWSSVGLEEPDVAMLKDGSLLIVCRGHSTAQKSGYKWMSRSTDGGRTLTPVEPLRYDDGSPVNSPDSIHYFFRSTRNGKLYWLANMLPGPASGQEPRYPLQIAEIDEEKLAVKRDSVFVIDDRGAGEPVRLQLSNFWIIEDRETLDLEIYMTRLGENAASFWSAPVYRYIFSPPRT